MFAYDPKESIQTKLLNCLRGSMMLLMDANDKMYTPEQKREEAKVIEEFVQYIKDYDKNQDIIQKYLDMQERLIDDGR